jgi:hypothetical protein
MVQYRATSLISSAGLIPTPGYNLLNMNKNKQTINEIVCSASAGLKKRKLNRSPFKKCASMIASRMPVTSAKSINPHIRRRYPPRVLIFILVVLEIKPVMFAM